MWWFLGLIGTAAAIMALEKRRERTRRSESLKHRPLLTETELYGLFCKDRRVETDRFHKALELVADTLSVEAGRLRPNDTALDLTALPKWLENSVPPINDIDELWYLIAQKAKRNGPGHDAARFETLGEIVLYLAR